MKAIRGVFMRCPLFALDYKNYMIKKLYNLIFSKKFVNKAYPFFVGLEERLKEQF